jgi:transcriptional regulator with XRE-family HTH domain
MDRAIGARLKALRTAAGLSLGDLSARSGVSKAMIARVERAESSATAALLGRLCAGLGTTLSSVVALGEQRPERIARLEDQPLWRDPESGYRRRHASPSGCASGIETIVVDLPPDVRISYSPWGQKAYTQQLLMLSGHLTLHIDDEIYELRDGDCIDFDVMRPIAFVNNSSVPARYLVIINRP